MAKTYTTVADLSVRSPFTEAIWDSQVRDNLNNLIVPPCCRVLHSANQSATNSVFTTVAFDTETFDTDTMHDTATNNPRITPTTAGVYVFQHNGGWAANVTGHRGAFMYDNTGAGYNAFDEKNAATTGGTGTSHSIGCLRSVNGSTDYLYIAIFQTSGAGLNYNFVTNLWPNFSAVWVGRTS